ncbi:phage head closure protein [Dehalobacter sp. UNSWDHB]|uniref:phage head closure protein n=1 Tax=Dehalobacter sp. UNSWDHB TaxID=1339256 RepID=UPI0006918458|nr:phage head closure protein [Dehalobacter sp. UNSWDHB]
MRWTDLLTLVALSEPDERVNEHGFPNEQTETAKTVFANKLSVGYSEFYKAAQAGYTAELKFDVYTQEYEGQEIAEYEGKRYRVLRTYVSKNGEFTELTLVDLPQAQAAPEGGGDDG